MLSTPAHPKEPFTAGTNIKCLASEKHRPDRVGYVLQEVSK